METANTANLNFAKGSPNEDFVRAWNTFLVPKFIRYRWQLTTGAALHADSLLRSFDIPRGGRALDIGCGFGESLHILSDMVGPEGHVLGVDCGDDYLEIARTGLSAAGRENVELLLADAQVHPFERKYDFVWSRNGTAFFQSPAAGFRNMRSALVPGGHMGLLVWRTVEENSFFRIAKEVALDLLPKPQDPDTCGPGPFSLSNPTRLEVLLEKSGFIDVEIEKSDVLYPVGRDLEDAVDFVLAIGPAGEVIREAGELGVAETPTIRARIAAIFAEHQTDGGVYMPSATWRVRAKNPR